MTQETKKTLQLLRIARTICIFLLIGFLAGSLMINLTNLSLDKILRVFYDLKYAVHPTELDSIHFSDTSDIQVFHDGVVVLSDNAVGIYGSAGNLYSSQVLHYSEPEMTVSENYVLCYDSLGKNWALIDSFRVLSSGTADGTILSASVSDSGYFSLTTSKPGYIASVTVYNKDGLPLSCYNSDEYPIATFFRNKSELYIFSLKYSDAKTDAVFYVFDYKKGEILFTDSLQNVLPIAWAEKASGVAVATSDSMYLFDGAKCTPLFAWNSIPSVIRFCDEDFLCNYNTSVSWYDKNGQVVLSLPVEAFDFCLINGKFLLLTKDGIVLYDKEGKEVKRYSSDFDRLLISDSLVFGISNDELIQISA